MNQVEKKHYNEVSNGPIYAFITALETIKTNY